MSLIEKQTDLLSKETLRTLLTPGGTPCVSLYMPTERLGRATQQNPIRLKNLLRRTAEELTALGLRSTDIRTLLAPAEALLTNDPFWQHQSDGLALFLRNAEMYNYRLPAHLDETVLVNERFYIKPLLPLLTDDGNFYLLTLNQKGVHLYQGSRFTLHEVALPENAPTSLAEELQYDEFEPSLQFHTGTGQPTNAAGARRAMYFGSGDESEAAAAKEQLMRFFRHLDNGVREAIREYENRPLVLVGIEYLQGLYREANEYKFLMDGGIEKDPDALTPEALHQQAWPLVEPIFQAARQQAMDTYLHLAGAGDQRAAHTLESIVAAAYYQRVDTLFAPSDRQQWGTFDPENMKVQVHTTRKPGNEDLFDFATAHTLLNGGAVYTLAPAELPGGAEIAALFRY
ncbi:MAG: hypothetical protein U0350_17575 [Caldilineaceae bacterium]